MHQPQTISKFPFLQKMFFFLFICILFACNEKAKTQNPEFVETTLLPGVSENSNRGIIYQSLDYGLSWISIKENLPDDLQCSFIAVKEDGLVLSTEGHGLYMRKYGDLRWQQIGDGLPNPKITALVVDDPIIYVGVYEAGIFKTEDNGNTWQSLNNNLKDLSAISILPFGNEILLGQNFGIMKASIVDFEWKEVYQSVQTVEIRKSGDKFLAGTQRGILISADNGETWNWISNDKSIHNLAVLDEKIVGMYISHGTEISEDWGKTWERRDKGMASYAYVFDMVKINDVLIACHHDGVYQSKDWGMTWLETFQTPIEKIREFAQDGDVIYGVTVQRE